MDFDKLSSYKEFLSLKPFDLKLLDSKRVKKYNIEQKNFSFNYAASLVTDEHIEMFKKIIDEAGVKEKFTSLLKGERVNTGENRAVLHHLTRGEVLKNNTVVIDGENKNEFYNSETQKVLVFANDIRSGKIKGSTGKRIKNVVQIGIGGSDLGPRCMCTALSSYANKNNIDIITPYFISNVDPEDAISVLKKIDPEETIFIMVSKSGTTLETLQNLNLVKSISEKKASKNFNFFSQTVVVTSSQSPLAQDKRFLSSFYMDDYIGGRYSSTSSVGTLIISLAFSFEVAQDFLNGAHETDIISYHNSLKENPTLLDALISTYYINACGYNTIAVLPYSQAMCKFTSHLAQLDMESNGKSVNIKGEKINYKTGHIIMGESGTNGQHSFYQHLHQGTFITPLEFIAFKENSAINSNNNSVEKDSHFKLNANVLAQIVAFAKGKVSDNLNKNFEGGRPSVLLYADSLTPSVLGALLSHFENKVMFQGFLWNINSFDQEGVQLGKVLTTSILKNDIEDEALLEYKKLLD